MKALRALWGTVDGQNPAPVDMVNIPLFAGFHTSQVVQDFVHQPYVLQILQQNRREPRTPFWQLNRCIGHAHQKAKDENHQQQKACEMTLALVQGPKNQFEVWWNTPL